MSEELCRLCSATKELIWLFDQNISDVSDDMIDIIHKSAGIEIKKTDSVSQKVCRSCCEITIKMYKFRAQSIKNNNDLKAYNAKYNISKMTNVSFSFSDKMKSSSAENSATSSQVNHRRDSRHKSVDAVIANYPQVKIPEACLLVNVNPSVNLQTKEVDKWLQKEKSLNEEQSQLPLKECGNVILVKQKKDTEMKKNQPKKEKRNVSIPNYNPDENAQVKTVEDSKNEIKNRKRLARNYKCPKCDCRCINKRHLKIHKKNHYVNCEFCKKMFKTERFLKRHVKYSCPENRSNGKDQKVPKLKMVRLAQDNDVHRSYSPIFKIVHEDVGTKFTKDKKNMTEITKKSRRSKRNSQRNCPNC